MSRPSTIVISDWLVNCRTEQWTPFEAAKALKGALEKDGYVIVTKEPPPYMNSQAKASYRMNISVGDRDVASAASARMTIIRCADCAEDFAPKSSVQKFCSSACRRRNYLANNKGRCNETQRERRAAYMSDPIWRAEYYEKRNKRRRASRAKTARTRAQPEKR